jgi:predicted LPLAT superfamily acyltransferase
MMMMMMMMMMMVVMIMSALYHTNTLNWIFIVLAHRNNNPRIDMSRTRYSDSEPTLLLYAYRRNSKYQFYSFWFWTIPGF